MGASRIWVRDCQNASEVGGVLASMCSGLEAIYQAPGTSAPHPAHLVYPYLFKELVIDRPNQVWCANITYIPVQRGFLYLVAIMDWATRHVLAWRLSFSLQ